MIVGAGAVALIRPGCATYHEFPVPPELRRAVRAVWSVAGGPTPWSHPVLPDGYSDLLVTPDLDMLAVGPATAASLQPVPVGARVVGARLRPGVLTRLVDARAEELRDRTVRVGVLDADRDDVPSIVTALCRRLTPLVRDIPVHENRVLAACRALDGATSEISVRGLAERLGISERGLRDAFSGQVGISPKAFHQIRRMQRTLVLLATRHPDRPLRLADLAVLGGYTDQAHLGRQARILTGMTPTELRDYRSVQDPGQFAARH